MKLSPAGLRLIAAFEGFRPVPYNDTAGNATIGFGHLLHEGAVTAEDQARYGTWTIDKGLAQLDLDAAVAEAAVTHSVHVKLGLLTSRAAARADALISLAFNIGAGAFASSTLVREINLKGAPRDWAALAPYWLEWDHAGGVIVEGLLNRRRQEFTIFVTGRYPYS